MKKSNLTVASSLLIGGLGIVPAQQVPAQSHKQPDKPDIILIITDQQTASAMSCAGNPYVKTPGMDRLAQDGIRFSRSYVTYPLSGPSRSSLITGRMPVEIGVKDNGGELSDRHIQNSIGYAVSGAGYDCLYAGKWHAPEKVNIPEEGTGFEKVCDMNDLILVDSCIPHLKKKREKPLFLVASFLNPHEICEFARDEALHYGKLFVPDVSECPPLPYNATIPAYYPEAITLHRQWVPKSYPTALYSDDDWRRYLYAYYRLVERVDKQIVRMIDELKKNNLYDNSLILFVSDHGDGVGAHRANQKRVLQEEIIRVPFIVKAPDSKTKGVVNDEALVSINLDIYQTICDYAGLGENNGLNGKSLRMLLDGKTNTHHPQVFVETLLDGIDTRGWSVVGKDFKYTLYRYFKNKEQLVNLKDDPYEMQNLAVDKQYESTLLDMRRKLYDWGLKTNDKMLVRLLKDELAGR
ncbi:arylsulfatase A-like enzyme [Dysgonomonas sp. PFB1-18]|uniref:sulfatase family protein n=1 Tax=unclassified Dysgonomonas TaxID=2630389 RepID=UPI002474F871|nr:MULTISPECIES: sulfatase-like hydrolase/transferase [unclassified Dysgonomonas]MDH6308914.1 arylsulfatase A-like enzyme [Dysgonomonas sp. PF1-14]MDH6338665.1 arylsulfatase A-like enzyme [Dysgonomonas sp. PF1-16]MDH6380307.1 arylsulfatase A-like enzyme [Dysgonomonas sp. PFB1-18]MDH6397637.1 arylsulfatase A-like enzyme [Dysgonomonas sp. PF1-23]